MPYAYAQESGTHLSLKGNPTMATLSTTTATKTTTTTVKASEATYSDLTTGTYSVKGSTEPTGGTIQARLLCSPAGSQTYYQDSRDANGMLTIDMTKEINMT